MCLCAEVERCEESNTAAGSTDISRAQLFLVAGLYLGDSFQAFRKWIVCDPWLLSSNHCVHVQKQSSVARAILLRVLQIALGLSFFLMVALYLGRSFVPRVFTSDPAVIAIAERVFPILAAFMVSILI